MDNEEDLIKNAHQVQSLCKEGGFDLEKFVSTSEKLLKSFLPEDINQNVDRIQFMNKDTYESVNTLGICWKIKEDTFAIELMSKRIHSFIEESYLPLEAYMTH